MSSRKCRDRNFGIIGNKSEKFCVHNLRVVTVSEKTF